MASQLRLHFITVWIGGAIVLWKDWKRMTSHVCTSAFTTGVTCGRCPQYCDSEAHTHRNVRPSKRLVYTSELNNTAAIGSASAPSNPRGVIDKVLSSFLVYKDPEFLRHKERLLLPDWLKYPSWNEQQLLNDAGMTHILNKHLLCSEVWDADGVVYIITWMMMNKMRTSSFRLLELKKSNWLDLDVALRQPLVPVKSCEALRQSIIILVVLRQLASWHKAHLQQLPTHFHTMKIHENLKLSKAATNTCHERIPLWIHLSWQMWNADPIRCGI